LCESEGNYVAAGEWVVGIEGSVDVVVNSQDHIHVQRVGVVLVFGYVDDDVVVHCGFEQVVSGNWGVEVAPQVVDEVGNAVVDVAELGCVAFACDCL
jgi:Iap family predicted aminopeptidase